MLKKSIKFCLAIALVAVTMSAMAQNTTNRGKAEYPRYGFWSNWTLGFTIDLNNQAIMNGNSYDAGWRRATNMGMDIYAQQRLNHALDWRLRFGFPSFWKPMQGWQGYYNDRHMSFSLDIMLSINNALRGYDPDCHWSTYLFVGGGLAFSGNDDDNPSINYEDYANVGVLLDGGIGFSYRFTDHYVFLEYGYDINGNAPKPSYFFTNALHHTNRIIRLGYGYNLGVTTTDRAVAAQKAMLTQENFTALNTQVNNLERQNTVSRNNEKKLENRIAELEDQLAQAMEQTNKGNSAAADSLQAVIDQIKADQLNFYALPFSVLYDVDDWKVSEGEMQKVKAIARVMKDNPDVKILAVGFADYSGSDQYNMKLSERRANEVKRLLVKKYGIDEDRIQTDYKGKSVAFGDIQYALNRRVSFYRVIE